jgi:16S rRNA (cytosine967-C5)-methyltransferase
MMAKPRTRIFAGQVAALAAAIGELAPLTHPADAALHRFFGAHRALGAQDRAFVAEGVFAWLRRRRSLEALAQSSNPRHLALAVVVRHLHASVRDLEGFLDTRESLWLAAFKSRLDTPLAPAEALDLPDWLWNRLGAALGDDARDAFAQASLLPAPLDLRVNPMKTTRDAALAALRGDGFDARATPYSPLGIRIDGRPALQRHPLFLQGAVEVQDEGSQLVAFALAPRRGEMVADFCAGAGGKTLALGALMRSTGRLYAFDTSARRLANFGPRLARSGLSNVHPQALAGERDAKVKRLAGKLDRVLVDAPCTGFGTLRRNPDLKWRQHEPDVAELAAKQAIILASAATLVKPGGRIVYATCSVLPDENDAVVDAFLAAHADFAEQDATRELARAGIALDTGTRLRVTPQAQGCDGFFAAILERRC